MPEPRRVTPADAKAVWEALEKAGIKPTSRLVADKLSASGKFQRISHNPVWKWHKAGWPTTPRQASRGGSLNAEAKLERDIEASVPLFTGDPTTTMHDLFRDPELAAERESLLSLSDDQLLMQASKESLITAIILMRRVQTRVTDIGTDSAKTLGTLQRALAGSVTAGGEAFEKLYSIRDKLLKIIPNEPKQVNRDEPDQLGDAFDAFDKARTISGIV